MLRSNLKLSQRVADGSETNPNVAKQNFLYTREYASSMDIDISCLATLPCDPLSSMMCVRCPLLWHCCFLGLMLLMHSKIVSPNMYHIR
jgi:hypothetical protein